PSHRQNNGTARAENGSKNLVEEDESRKASNDPATSVPRAVANVAHSRPPLETSYVPPRNETELVIAESWQEMLGVQPVGINDNFFALGGDSLLAIQVTSSMQKKLQVEFVLHTFLESPTVAEMAESIERRLSTDKTAAPKIEKTPSPLLVEIQRGGPRLPLFFMHAVGGSVFIYRELAQYLGTEQPVY